MKKVFERKRIWSILLVLVLLISQMSGCGSKTVSEEQIDGFTEKIVADITAGLTQKEEPDSIVEELNLKPVENFSGIEELEQVLENALAVDEKNIAAKKEKIAQEFTKRQDIWEDTEVFVYNLIANEVRYRYDVFPAYVELKDGTWIGGIAYSDYTDCYSDGNGTHYYFTAGFLPFADERVIPEEEFNYGLLLHNADYQSKNFSFLLTYLSGEYTEHCVVYNQYVKYGADKNGQMTYTTAEYIRGECEESLGSLYSYDEKRYVRDVDVGNYMQLSGTTLSEQINYAQLERQINELLELQDINLATVDVESNAYYAQEAVMAYLLSLQEETFLGYKVSDLVKAAEQVDVQQVLRITEGGLAVIDLQSGPKEGLEAVANWLVGTTCVIVTAVGMVTSVVTVSCPVLSACAGAVAGTAIDVFMQVVVENEDLQNVSWEKVVLSAVTGAVSGFLGPYITANVGGLSGFFLDSAIDGLLGGIEYAAISWLDGGTGIECISSFGYGLALGGVLSTSFKCISGVIATTAQKMAPSINKLGKEVFPSLTENISDIKRKLANLKETEDHSIFQSQYIAEKNAYKNVKAYAAETIENVNDFGIVDNIVRKYTKADLVEFEDLDIFDEGALEHVFLGELKKDSIISGFHSELFIDANTTIDRSTKEYIDSKYGIYRAKVLGKSGNNGMSTFFPENMSLKEIKNAIKEAYNTRKLKEGETINNGLCIGTAKNGMLIEMYIRNGKIVTFYPSEVQ